jgi:hypothetical protein
MPDTTVAAPAANLPSIDMGAASGGARMFDPSVAANPDANASLGGLYRFGASADEALSTGPVANLALIASGFGGSNLLTSDEANAKYGIQGPTKDSSLSWEPGQTVYENQAQMANAMTRTRTQDNYISSLRPATWTGWASNTAGDFLGSALDPLNTAASFLPVGWLGRGAETAFAAAKLDQAAADAASLTRSVESSAASRIGAAALQNAGAVALTQPIIMAGAQADHTDYTFADAAGNILFGGLLGAGLHGIGEVAGMGFRRFLLPPDSPSTAAPGSASGFDLDGQPAAGAPQSEGAGLPLDLPRDASQNQALADQMAQRLGGQDLESVTAALNPSAMTAAWDSASEVGRDIGADENLSPEQKQDGIGSLNRFIGEMNDHAGSLQYPPIDSAKVISGGGNGGDLDSFFSQLHPAVDSISDALQNYRTLQDLKALRASSGGTIPAILGSQERVDLSALQDGSTARGMMRAGAASMDSTHSLSPAAASDMLAASRPRVIDDLTQQLNRKPTEDEIGSAIEQRSQQFMDNKAAGKYSPHVQPLEPIDASHATPEEIQKAVDRGDYETAAKLTDQHTQALEQDPAFRMSETAKAEVNAPVEKLSTIKSLIEDFTACVAQEAA